MRSATSGVELITDKGEIVGVSLGADFAAEHECGIKHLRKRYACDPTKMGLHASKINGGDVFLGEVQIRKETWFYISSSGDLSDRYVSGWYTHKDKDSGTEVCSGWDQKHFAFLCKDAKVIEALAGMFRSNDMALTLGSTGPFHNAGLSLIQFSKIPEETLAEASRQQEAYEEAKKTLETSNAYLLLKENDRQWREKYPFAWGTPWSYMALSPRGDSDHYWLNPEHQSHLQFGWLSLQDIQDWAEGKVGAVIRSQELWEDLLWELSIPVTGLYALRNNKRDGDTYTKFFRRTPLGVHRLRNEPLPPFPKKGKHEMYWTLSEKTLDQLESDIKREALDSMFRQIDVYDYRNVEQEYLKDRLQKYIEGRPKSSLKPSEDANKYIFAVLHTLSMLGFGTFGACNVPEGLGLKNLSFWKSILEYEVSYDFLNLCGMIPENRKLPELRPDRFSA